MEPLFLGEILLALRTPVTADVDHAEAPLPEHAADQPPPMAIGRVFFTAQESRRVACGSVQEPLEALPKSGRLSQPIVEDVPFTIIELFAFRSASQEVAEKQVFDPSGAEVLLERLLVEVGDVAGVGA